MVNHESLVCCHCTKKTDIQNKAVVSLERIRSFWTLFPNRPTESEDFCTDSNDKTDKTGGETEREPDGQKVKPELHGHNEWKMIPAETENRLSCANSQNENDQ